MNDALETAIYVKEGELKLPHRAPGHIYSNNKAKNNKFKTTKKNNEPLKTPNVVPLDIVGTKNRLPNNLSRIVRKPVFCICENKDADQLRGNREADQRLCFRYTDSTIPLLSKPEISSF